MISEKSRVKKIILQMADQEGVAPETIRSAMQDALDAAWENKNKSYALAWKNFSSWNETQFGGIHPPDCQ